jgi:hypothetical protein
MNYFSRPRNGKVAKFKPAFTKESFALQQAFANRVPDTITGGMLIQTVRVSCAQFDGHHNCILYARLSLKIIFSR